MRLNTKYFNINEVLALVSLNNTKTAFSHLSDLELKKAQLLFLVLKNRFLSELGPKILTTMIKYKFPVLTIVKKTMFAHFCGGESIEDCQKIIEKNGQKNVGAILDFSVEGENSEESYEKTFEEIKKTVEASSKSKHIPFAVFKITGICSTDLLEKRSKNVSLGDLELAAWHKAENRCEAICRLAAESQTMVFIDAEQSFLQDAIDHLCEKMMKKFNSERVVVFNTVQLYRHDRLSYVKRLYEDAAANHYKIGLKLVRGAYLESERELAALKGVPSPIHKNKIDVDNDFDNCVEYCLDRLEQITVCVATHNQKSVAKLIEKMSERDIQHSDNRIWCAQLLGMSDHISFNLGEASYNTAKYVPYGPVAKVLPYLFRRAEENSSIQGQSSREYDLLTEEIERRKR